MRARQCKIMIDANDIVSMDSDEIFVFTDEYGQFVPFHVHSIKRVLRQALTILMICS
jgi:hypothetical protein